MEIGTCKSKSITALLSGQKTLVNMMGSHLEGSAVAPSNSLGLRVRIGPIWALFRGYS